MKKPIVVAYMHRKMSHTSYDMAAGLTWAMEWSICNRDNIVHAGADRFLREPEPKTRGIRTADVEEARRLCDAHFSELRQPEMTTKAVSHMREQANVTFASLRWHAIQCEQKPNAMWLCAYNLVIRTADADADDVYLADLSAFLMLTEVACVRGSRVSVLHVPENCMLERLGLRKFGNQRRLSILCQSVRAGIPVVKRSGLWSWTPAEVMDWLHDKGYDSYLLRDEDVAGDTLATMTFDELRQFGLPPDVYELVLQAVCADMRATSLTLQLPEYPAHLCCPITHDLMTDPVVASDGITYERCAIQVVLDSPTRVSPITRAVLEKQLLPNRALQSVIELFRIGQTLAREHERSEPCAKRVCQKPDTSPGPVLAMSNPTHRDGDAG